MKKSVGIKPALLPTPALVIGTYDGQMRPNVMVAAWGGICSGDPVSVAFSVQRSRHTFAALMEKKECTISIPSVRYIRETDYFGVISGRDCDKFTKTGLTPVRAEHVNAPYVSEFPIILECRISQIVEIGIHVQFIAEVIDVKIESSLIDEEGKIHTENEAFFSYDPLCRCYVAIGETLMKAFTMTSEEKLTKE